MTTLMINGKQYELDAEDDMPLLWVIRDIAGLTGTKFGCGIGMCGACSIHLDGELVRSCMMSFGAAKDKAITTIEGLGSEQGLHPVQQAWIDKDVSQCGYCQPGQIMAAAALLRENPNPSEDEIRTKMTNYCRCGTYLQIFEAVKQAAQLQGEQS
ncbi:(2Fe-2S)-binding protein [Methylotuvimicrobium buryatense]|uniref:(2Fe-2S)-binding protein n=1 Tax=Methylotuvimicrobium buryatense TaxID=95641 RepID=A0A4P9UMM6_METBY|nr:(2Fe-2S)-binding protein [Methylotuvimicrobium buryatense]QCW82544.1 (2Fe-2S)-binding protein [Methylotuvimicrobium buryatense]